MLSPAKNSNPLVLIGLGNPGNDYVRTRHNIGFLVLDHLFPHASWKHNTALKALIAKETWNDQLVFLVKPQTFMNVSGEAVRAFAQYHHLPISSLLVLHDEADIAFGTVKFKGEGGHAGHNGIRSLIECLGTNAFARLRLGIGRPPHPQMPLDEFVLQPFTTEEQAALPTIFSQVQELAIAYQKTL